MPKVLLVDDDIAEISAVKRVIARAGHQAVLATSSADALALLAQSSPALLVVGSTCENGEALLRFAEADEVRGIPLVVLGDGAAAPEGASLLPRPVDPAQLAERLAAALRAPPPSAAPARRSAADALLARAEELRRGAGAARDLAPEASRGQAPATLPTLAAPPHPDEDPGLEAILRRAEEAERAAAAETSSSDPRPVGTGANRTGVGARARAEQRARPAASARAELEGELDRLERQLDAERQDAHARLRGEVERAASERAAAARRGQEEDARRREEQDARRRAEEEARRKEAGEEQLRTAIASARAEMEGLRRRSEDEARRRRDAEAELARLAALAPGDPPPPDPAPDAAEGSARRRVAALRGEAERAEHPRAPLEVPVPPPVAGEQGPDASAPRLPPPAELRAGTLAEVPAPRLFALAARAELSGRVDFEGEASRSIYFEEGAVVGATSSSPAERVEELALRLGLVTREQHRQVAATAAPLATRRAALVLLERGFLKPTELTGLVRRRTEEVVFGVFGDPAASFHWSGSAVPADERTALERTTLALAVEGVRRRWLAPQVDAVLGGAGTLLTPLPEGPSHDGLALSAGERRAVALADGLRTLDEILAASPLDSLSTRQALAALVLVGALSVRTFQGGRSAAAATVEIDLARVRDKLEQVRRADYFAILGVGRLCTPHEVREASERLSAEFDPCRFQGVREDGLERRLEEIRAVVADARDVLGDDRLRHEYLRGLGE